MDIDGTTLLAAGEFQAYGTSHLVVLALFAIGLVPVVLLGRRVRGTTMEATTSRVLALGIVAVTVPLQVLQLLPDEWSPRTSLPFQLCDLAWMFAVHALWTRSRLTSTVTYLWGLTLTTQGMATPDLSSNWPEPRFIMFWAMHVLIVWAAVYLVAGLRVLPTWATYRRTVVVTLVWAASVMTYNALMDTNYGYLNGKPNRASLLDVLPAWPYYVAVEIVVVAAVWALLVWPWTRRGSAAHVGG
ncbi:MAG: TIGR02206 family membrane protein [Propionibacteriales bacterium]|nr:TIGR02206 family membrane protein [Propionibacteriales bacterium]